MTPAQICHAGLAICILISSVHIVESLSFKMVRRDAIDPTMFQKNLSNIEKTRIFVNLSYSRLYNRTRQDRVGPDAARPRLRQFGSSIFGVPFRVGTEGSGGYLAIDTGSDLTWVQCEGCTNCPPLQGIRYDRTKSHTYRRIPWDSPDCQTGFRLQDDCAYEYGYVTGHINGIKGFETFTFQSTEQPGQTDIVLSFGCTLSMDALPLGSEYGERNELAGVFGLAVTRDSFLTRTQATTKMKFSYCLPSWELLDAHVEAELTFGDDVPRLHRNARLTPMDPTKYFLDCIDLSVGPRWLRLNPSVFQRKPDGSGGLLIDSGSGYTVLVHEVFERVKSAFIDHFASHNVRAVPADQLPSPEYKLCFPGNLPRGFKHWMPTMTWHFRGADLVVDFWNNFLRIRKDDSSPPLVCMAILDGGDHGDAPNLLGAVQQADYRFWYDLTRGSLAFVKAKCPAG